MPASRRAASIAAGAAALAVVAAAVLVLVGPLGGPGKHAADPPCSSYPAPGTLAPADTKVPTGLTAKYSVFGDRQRAVDRLSPGQAASLGASGLIMSGTRLLGDAAFRGRIYLVPAEHLLASSLAPPRCLSPVQRVIEQDSLPLLRSEYSQAALCIVVLYGKSGTHDCAPASGTPYTLLSEIGTPGFGLVPNGVSTVTVTYQVAPPRTVPVHRNFFVIGTASHTALPCGVEWLAIGQDDGAYGCFGALGGKIDGLAAGHPLGTSDPGFTGFHRIEFDLWTKRDLRGAGSDTATLKRLLAQLMRVPLSTYLPATATGIGNWLLRPHEVLEDALRDSLTADDDYGSGTSLASVAADVAAVRAMLGQLGPAVDPVAPHLVSDARAELDALTGGIEATHASGAWTSVRDLPARRREQVDAGVGAALETLAPIPDLLTSTGSNSPNS